MGAAEVGSNWAAKFHRESCGERQRASISGVGPQTLRRGSGSRETCDQKPPLCKQDGKNASHKDAVKGAGASNGGDGGAESLNPAEVQEVRPD